MIKTALWSGHSLILKRFNMLSGWKFSKCLKKRVRFQMPLSTICSAGWAAGLISFAAGQLTQTTKAGWKGWPSTLSGPRFLKERMVYVPYSEAADGLARVIYQAKDGNSSKTFLAKLILKSWMPHL